MTCADRGNRAAADRLAWFLTLCLASLPAAAAEIVAGSGCALADAITAANTDQAVGGCTAGDGSDTILLTADVVLMVIDNSDAGPNGLPVVTSRVTIDGEGFSIIRDGSAPHFRILRVGASGALTLRHIEVSGGRATALGGGVSSAGELALHDTTISDNSVSSGGGILRGGGIHSTGQTSISESRILSNTVEALWGSAFGGGVFSTGPLSVSSCLIEGNAVRGRLISAGAGINGRGPLAVSRSTIHLNTASAGILDAEGGGIAGRALTVSNTTLTGNSADEGGALAGSGTIDHATFYGNGGSGAIAGRGGGLSVSGSVFAGSGGDHCRGAILDVGGNLADDLSCPPISAMLSGLDSTLADNGGGTPTHALLEGSSAIDHAGACGLETDQRGAGRSGSCDSGAFERPSQAPAGWVDTSAFL